MKHIKIISDGEVLLEQIFDNKFYCTTCPMYADTSSLEYSPECNLLMESISESKNIPYCPLNDVGKDIGEFVNVSEKISILKQYEK